MELRQFFKLIFKNSRLFFGIWLGIFIFGLLITLMIPKKQIAVLSLDIARDRQEQASEDFRYDQFYRLEADDRFANTLVQWSKDPNVQRKIKEDALKGIAPAGVELAIESLRAEKKAANLVQIAYEVEKTEDAGVFAKSLFEVLQQKTSSLNNGQQDQGWFKIIGSGPTVGNREIQLVFIFVALLAGGLLISIFAVLTRHYFEHDEKSDENRD